jgi:hypothetical protein
MEKWRHPVGDIYIGMHAWLHLYFSGDLIYIYSARSHVGGFDRVRLIKVGRQRPCRCQLAYTYMLQLALNKWGEQCSRQVIDMLIYVTAGRYSTMYPQELPETTDHPRTHTRGARMINFLNLNQTTTPFCLTSDGHIYLSLFTRYDSQTPVHPTKLASSRVAEFKLGHQNTRLSFRPSLN